MDINNKEFFYDHPALSRLVQLRTGVGWKLNRSQYIKAAAMKREAQGKLERDRAILVQGANNIEMQGALAQMEWSDIRSVTVARATTIQTPCRLNPASSTCGTTCTATGLVHTKRVPVTSFLQFSMSFGNAHLQIQCGLIFLLGGGDSAKM